MKLSIKLKWKKTVWISLLCGALLTLPISTVWGVGKGSVGADVFAVQGMLASLGDFNGTITGQYGTLTTTAVQNFQRRYGLPVTGTVDDKTLQSILWAYSQLKITMKSTPIPPVNRTPSQPFKPAPSTYPITGLTAEEEQMIQMVNQARAQAGLKALIVDSALTQTARLKSQDMINLNYFEHQSPTYGSPFDMMNQFGITFQSAGENIACNQTVAAAHQALMNSQGHRENILNSSFTHIGIGIINGGKCGQMYTQQFVGR
ncbi:hypothetical protein EHS13_25250 [Paenibacillus psychroresistens]|uniref:SCP-like extracellular n=1 Tax=Paenibacillus psychroresistens TaxID=1778678 RepID=A0A6B8RNN5_9BACL|nr:CAP domain-containing protein [Paenibacillus psychroresistens]QGQ97961.1 hypothetical protein EHS13_25250 [Paenibacillus psychroresistens]